MIDENVLLNGRRKPGTEICGHVQVFLLHIFLHEFLVELGAQGVVDEAFLLACIIHSLGTVLEHNIIIPPWRIEKYQENHQSTHISPKSRCGHWLKVVSVYVRHTFF